jgi:5-methylcytosine-specific restriction enzyme subunit McrC
MNIPIANIYYLLSYAWDHLDEREIVDVHPEDETELIDLFARVLINGTNHVLRRGLDRGYIAHEEAVAGIRGKFVPAATIKRNLLMTGRAQCDFDELSPDVVHNQILKATFTTLLRSRNLDTTLREETRDLRRRLAFVTDVDVTNAHFRRAQVHRNNAFYDLLLKVCRFVMDNLMIDERTGHALFRDFERDVRQMRKLFEAFVLNFFRRHLQGVQVTAPQIDWYGIDRFDADAMTLPRMQTDIVVSSDRHAVIIDTKFTPHAFASHYDVERARSGHLYQIFAYVKNYALQYPARHVSGMLLYPVIDQPFACLYRLHQHTIEIRSIDLRKPWRLIESEMKNLVSTEDDNAFSSGDSARVSVRSGASL